LAAICPPASVFAPITAIEAGRNRLAGSNRPELLNRGTVMVHRNIREPRGAGASCNLAACAAE
jgi:hypothetical protein